MQLSSPIYRLKRDAKRLSRQAQIPLATALDRLARQEGFESWGLLAQTHARQSPAVRLAASLNAGELVLISARPGHGKTMLALEIVAETVRRGGHGAVFTLDFNRSDVEDRLPGATTAGADRLIIDASDEICADYIIGVLREARPTMICVDYLQLLDQRRDTPPLGEQIAVLKAFARGHGHTILMVSQIDRAFERSSRSLPNISDIRLPNPVDLSLFDKACFLNEGEIEISAVA